MVSPYYNRPSQEGVYQHFRAINDAVQLPVLVYNVPSRTGSDVSNETMARLARLPNIVGGNWTPTGDLGRASLMRLECGEDFVMLSGDDPTALGYMAHGGHGCISVTANVAPEAFAALMEAAMQGAYGAALARQDQLMRLHRALFFNSSPAPTGARRTGSRPPTGSCGSSAVSTSATRAPPVTRRSFRTACILA